MDILWWRFSDLALVVNSPRVGLRLYAQRVEGKETATTERTRILLLIVWAGKDVCSSWCLLHLRNSIRLLGTALEIFVTCLSLILTFKEWLEVILAKFVLICALNNFICFNLTTCSWRLLLTLWCFLHRFFSLEPLRLRFLLLVLRLYHHFILFWTVSLLRMHHFSIMYFLLFRWDLLLRSILILVIALCVSLLP